MLNNVRSRETGKGQKLWMSYGVPIQGRTTTELSSIDPPDDETIKKVIERIQSDPTVEDAPDAVAIFGDNPPVFPEDENEAFPGDTVEVTAGDDENEAFPGDTVEVTAGDDEKTPDAVELDSLGLPWDARINPKSRLKLVKEGTWKLIRKLEPDFVEMIRDELRSLMAGNPVIPESEVKPLGDPPLSFPEFSDLITLREDEGIQTREQLLQVLTANGIGGFPSLACRPDLVPKIAEELALLTGVPL